MIALKKPEKTIDQLKALAASGSSRFARAAQNELKARTTDAIRRSVGL